MKIEDIQNQYGVSSLIASILSYRNCTEELIYQILHPSDHCSLSECDSLKFIKERILIAKEKNEKVFIAGDYDCDGIMATTIMKETLDNLKIENGFYIPNRFKEGYGLSNNTVLQAIEKGYTLIITVDNGVMAKGAIEACNEAGIDILIIDHHTIQEQLNWTCLLHSDVMEPEFAMLCGAGLALQVSMSLIGNNKKHLILAMIATLGDMVPVFNENRTIIQLGIKALNEVRLPQLEMLLDQPVKIWTEKELAYQIIPKINAVGRLADIANVNNVVRYFLLSNPENLLQVAGQIKQINNKRKALSESMIEVAKKKQVYDSFRFIVDDQFHEGLVGLVANRLVQEEDIPVAVFTLKDNVYKGSVRSGSKVNLIDFFDEFKHDFITFGGHQKAAALSIEKEKFPYFKDQVITKMDKSVFVADNSYAIPIESNELRYEFVQEIDKLFPFGTGFETPIFEVKHFEIISSQLMKEKFPKWKCRNSEFEFEAISFNLTKQDLEFPIKSFVATLELNEFMGKKRVNLMVSNLK